MDEYMRPNCITPWKCNGPHIPIVIDPKVQDSANRAAAIDIAISSLPCAHATCTALSPHEDTDHEYRPEYDMSTWPEFTYDDGEPIY